MQMSPAIKDRASVALITAACVAAYVTALGNGFAWDDIYLVVKNPYIRGWENVPGLFTTGYWASIGETGGLYRPLTMLSFLAERTVAGPGPLVFHIDNLLLHVACSILVFYVLTDVLGKTVAPLLGALVFAVHPVHTEAVAWVSGRAELLSTLFFLLAFLSFARPLKRFPWYVVSPLFYLLGILAKETAATLPAFVVLYLLLVRRERNFKSVLASVAPYMVVLALYIPVRLHVLGGHIGPEVSMFGEVDAYHVVLTMFKAGFNYVRLAFIPTGLEVAYIFPPPDTLLNPKVLGFAALVGVLAAFTPKLARSMPREYFLGAWFFVALLPVSNIIPTEVIMTERAMYLPTVGTCGLIGLLFAWAAKRIPAGAVYASFAALLVAFTAMSLDRNAVWKDRASISAELLRINERLVSDFPDNPRAYTKLGESYLEAGRLSEAGPMFERALSLTPKDADAHFGLASAYRAAGMPERALTELEQAVEHGYREPDAAYVNMAAILYAEGDEQRSEALLKKAMETNPDNAMAWLNYGYLRHDRGMNSEALYCFVKAGELDPTLYEAFFQQGLVLGEAGDFGGASAALERAVGLRPENPEARLYLGAAYEAGGLLDKAAAQYRAALETAPDFAPAKARLEAVTAR